MKCKTDARDVCHNINACWDAGICIYKNELAEKWKQMENFKDKCQDPNGCQLRCIDKCYFYLRPEQPRVPEFMQLLEQMKEIHLRKNKDYASEANPFSNFERSAALISWFENPVDKAFIALIGTKLARLAELLQEGRTANNESVDDSFLDLATYCALWASYRKRQDVKSNS